MPFGLCPHRVDWSLELVFCHLVVPSLYEQKVNFFDRKSREDKK